MKIDQPTHTKRLIDWLRRHKIPAIITSSVILLLAIYGGYFLITYFTSRRIIMERD